MKAHRDAWTVLASPIRREILLRLPRCETAKALARALDITRQAVQRHLDEMLEAGVVEIASPGSNRCPTRYKTARNVLGWVQEAIHRTLPLSPDTATHIVRGDATASLLLLAPVPGMKVDLSGRDEWRIGRGPWATLPLPMDPFMSNRHATLRRCGAGWSVEDMGSRNGTRVHGIRVVEGEEVPVGPRATLIFGGTCARLC